MPGRHPFPYFRDPQRERPVEAIYEDLDAWTYELELDDPAHLALAGLTAVLPPLYHDGVFVKGLYMSHGVDLLVRDIPSLPAVAFGIANSMWCSYPWSRSADAMFTLYDNPARERWYADRHPERASVRRIPLQDADFTDDAAMAPRDVPRDLDVVAVARLAELKNLPMLVEGLAAYERRRGRRARMTVVVGTPFGPGFEGLDEEERATLREVEAAADDVDRYVEWRPHVDYWHEMPQLLSRARCVVLGSLLEGKNRSLHEAMSCDTPVVCFRDYNRAARGPAEAFPPGAGVYAESFAPEALADAFHEVFRRGGELRPRAAYLGVTGRKRSFDRCLGAFDYYRDVLALVGARPVHDDPWLDAAMRACHGISLADFIARRPWQATGATGIDEVRRLVAGWLDGVGRQLRRD